MSTLTDIALRHRTNQHGSHDLFHSRWSPRAMTGESIPEDTLMALFEAAHWAPSAGNHQPWRFLFARRETPPWDTFFGLLASGNQRWCASASALVVIVSKTTLDHNGKFSPTHAFSTGAAWGMFALEGAMRGLVVHGMAGFDYARAKTELQIPDGYEVQAMVAIGILADAATLPDDLREREIPSGRKELSQLCAEGPFTDALV